MSKISCEVIRDLFPSYIDGLTSEASNQAVEEHVAGCEECRKLLASMKAVRKHLPRKSRKRKRSII